MHRQSLLPLWGDSLIIIGFRQDPTVQHELAVSLEDIYKGCTKKMKITRFHMRWKQWFQESSERRRSVVSDRRQGFDDQHQARMEEWYQDHIPQGGRSTPRTCARRHSLCHQGVSFRVFKLAFPCLKYTFQDKAHPKFKREGADIRYVAKIPLRDALCGINLSVPTLDGTTHSIRTAEIIKPNSLRRYPCRVCS